MPDVKDVIKGLECCNSLHNDSIVKCATDCPYWEFDANCRGFVMRDALALLKAQEQEIEDLKQEIEGHKDNLRETLDEMMRYADELKAQEPVSPVKVNRYMETDENGNWFSPETYDCGNCGVELHGKANYCHLCGRVVKW